MIYFSSSLIVLLILLFDISFLPHFYNFGGVTILMLPMIILMCQKDRTIFPLILAGIVGFLFDGVSNNVLPVYSISFTLVGIVSKLYFARYFTYNEYRSNLILLSLGLTAIFLLEIGMINIAQISPQWLLSLVVTIIASFICIFLYTIIFKKYFDWLDKETESRFR